MPQLEHDTCYADYVARCHVLLFVTIWKVVPECDIPMKSKKHGENSKLCTPVNISHARNGSQLVCIKYVSPRSI